MLLQPKCPLCQSTDLSIFKYYNTAHNGTRKLFKCDECREHFSETKNSLLEGIRKPLSLIQQVLNARTEGMGLNAATRVFPVSKNTLLDWERKFSKLKDPLFTYSLTHDFIQQEIEGDELYTKVKENKPAHESEGWTIVFMGFTSCGHVCPMIMAKLRAIKEAMKMPVEVLFVSLDPESDTPEKIHSYVRGFDASFTGATGAPEEIARFANALGAPYFVDSSADPYIVDHSSALFIVNPAGAFAAVFTAPHEIEPIAAGLDELLSKN